MSDWYTPPFNHALEILMLVGLAFYQSMRISSLAERVRFLEKQITINRTSE